MDIKIGVQSFGEDADADKKQKMKEKDEQTTTVSLGFRITALNVNRYFFTRLILLGCQRNRRT